MSAGSLPAPSSARPKKSGAPVGCDPDQAKELISNSPKLSKPHLMSQIRYVVITPVRNEEARIVRTIDSVCSQTIRPNRWILVNDGSTDGTQAKLEAASREHSWIQTIQRADRGFRKPGTGVIEAFYEGFELVESQAWDYLVKLDGDLEFAPDYFEKCFARFSSDSRLGIAGGRVCSHVQGALIDDSPGDPAFHVRGATKIYRRAAWEAIGGLLKAPGWDTLDELKANMLGWRTCSFKDLQVVQLKGTGSADGSWRNWFKNGRANYITGYHPVFMLLKCLSRALKPPYLVAGVGLFSGFLMGYLKRIPQVPDEALIKYLRQQQWNRLLGKQSLWG
jgi:glycosyltransferase involved in cell wall biosynthesis